ncbi:MAG: hypothetical protein EBZ67_03980, partial [Chitinophagia bacterium]|nr:hypothetical protein [Chitinophagia bacterium]
YGLLLRLSAFLEPSSPLVGETDGVLYTRLLGTLPDGAGIPLILWPLLAYLLVYGQALLLDRFMNRERLLGKAGQLPAMSYLLVTALVPDWWSLSAPLLANTLLLPVISLSSDILNNRKAGMLMFYAGLLTGLSALVHFPSFLLILLPYFAIVSLGPFPIVVWLLALTGFILPFYYVFSLQFLLSEWDPGSVWMAFRPTLPLTRSPGTGVWTWVALLLPLAIGFWHMNRQVFRMLIRNRKCWNLFIVQLAIASAAPFLFPTNGSAVWIALAPGLSAYHANAYVHIRRRWMVELLHLACIGAVVLAHASR